MAPPHTIQLADRGDRALMIAIHDALRRDLDQLLHATASHPGRARQEAATAIAICTVCPARGHCLTLSLRLLSCPAPRERRRVFAAAGLCAWTG